MGSRRVLGSSKGSTTAGLEPDFGTGRQWRPLDQALDVLWQAGAWRQELIQLLELLAERTDRRLHPLPWALPVPLRVPGHYTRAEIEAAHCYGEACGLRRAHHRIPLEPPRRGALAPSQRHRPAVHHPAQKRSPLLPLHPLPRPGPRPRVVPLRQPQATRHDEQL